MDSSFQTDRTATATTATRTISTTTMTATAAIRSIAKPSTTAGRPAADARHDLCWCGQDMDLVRGNHCPRCGTMRVARVGAVPPRLAA
jgi:hypothetical protein